MQEAIWILQPKQKVHGDIELAMRPTPPNALDFQLVDLDENIQASGKCILDGVGDEIAQELFRNLLFLLPEDESDINTGKMMLKVCGRTYRQGPCHTTAYIPDTKLAYERELAHFD